MVVGGEWWIVVPAGVVAEAEEAAERLEAEKAGCDECWVMVVVVFGVCCCCYYWW